jgi:uncharacterized protein (TIGR00255 family)
MIKSMTGFGKRTVDLPERHISIEIKSLNSKQFDANLRLPAIYREKEAEIRLMLSSGLGRGKVDCNINLDSNGESAVQQFNRPLAKMYYEEIALLAKELGLGLNNELINTVVRMPDVLKAEQISLSKEEWLSLKKAVEGAIHDLNEFRTKEGAALEADLIERVDTIENLMLEVAPLEEARITHVRERLQKSFEDAKLAGATDQNRFEQEVIYYLEKLDITEEKVRLGKHCQYFKETLNDQGANGKKLGFISQEMGREINTLGSKANNYDIQKIVVLMKDELEKIKEQLFNIL